MNYQSHSRILTPGASRKRKEKEALYSTTSFRPLVPQAVVSRAVSGTNLATTSSKGAEQPPPPPPPLSSNRLLAGYMACEFLTRGTLFGQKFDPARAEAVPLNSADPIRNRKSQSQSLSQPSAGAEPSDKSKPQGYFEVANLLKSDGAHIPGVVNPTQLARWIQM